MSLEEKCTCGAPLSVQVESCVACGQHAGFPNVRLLALLGEHDALSQRWNAARTLAKSGGYLARFESIVDEVGTKWRFVVAVPLKIAEMIVGDPKNSYVNYEKLVGSEARRPADFADDAHRRAVAGVLFASIGEKIVYGALALSGSGLATYGEVFLTLNDNAVKKRVTFLETNSYDFVKTHGLEALPKGYRSDWANRGKLAVSKLCDADAFRIGAKAEMWRSALFFTDGQNRNKDEFIEGHLYGSFNLYSIDSITTNTAVGKIAETVEALVEIFEAQLERK